MSHGRFCIESALAAEPIRWKGICVAQGSFLALYVAELKDEVTGLEQALAEQKRVTAAGAEEAQKQASEAQKLRQQLDQLRKDAQDKETQLSAVMVGMTVCILRGNASNAAARLGGCCLSAKQLSCLSLSLWHTWTGMVFLTWFLWCHAS